MTASITSESTSDILQISDSLRKVEIGNTAPYEFIDTASVLSGVLDILHGLPTVPPSIFIDLEGENLSRHGTISILQIHVLPLKRTYLIDLYTLDETAFSVTGARGQTLKQILESSKIPKVIFDVRNDSDALYKHFNIRLAGMQDLQLMEVATRSFGRKHVNGLAKCIERDASLSAAERQRWKDCKETGIRLFAPERGGSYKVFNHRPMSKEILQYCVQDVHFMPRLWAYYNGKMTPQWHQRAEIESKERVKLSQSPSYVSHGPHKALAPRGWLYL
ncbi:hypothetical protein LMH87_001497 [Akanthomyces muscarius]|uniref:3'-5' exonuclease n=2 Tax=Akanthomyces TaxID=150366 RepID=A0A167T2K2_CORDF|nr:hypothetical protein LMH87_001497 [Akanthomyces muscarius]KAJ4146943.1 hypothetical protein LMH87_001497 [Akanthomyces muscarius]OAA60179.1 3'-5' exonuclease [Akanthomyces lecanii RCEF 1005]